MFELASDRIAGEINHFILSHLVRYTYANQSQPVFSSYLKPLYVMQRDDWGAVFLDG